MTVQRVDERPDIERGENPVVRYLGVRIPDELFEAVKAAAERDRRTLTAWVTIALEQHLARQERREREQDGERG
jgi:hypothetical protein